MEQVKPFVYKAELLGVVDGDTLDVLIDLGFDIKLKQRIRLLGINTPETKGKTRTAGLESKEFVKMWMDSRQFVIQTEKDKQEKFGRILGKIYDIQTQECLNDLLIKKGLAVPYDGGKRE